MKRRACLMILAGMVSVSALLAPASAAASTRLYVQIGPPAPIVEPVVVAPGPAYVWTPGYYRWDGRAYVWVGGRYAVPPRPHAVWVAGRWHHHHSHGWYWVNGHWR